MALINYPECNKEISDKAKGCPYCGCPINQKEKKNLSKKIMVILLSVLLVMGIVIGFIMMLMNSKTLGEMAVENSFKELDKILLAPDTINVHECVSRDFTKEENNRDEVDESNEPYKEVMVYIHFSVSNSGGGITESEYIFACDKEGNVIEYMDLADMESTIAEGKMSALIMDYDNYVFFASLNGWDEDYVIYTTDEVEKLMK
ncbi:MAG: zinc ribbon domain-containing protein [Lachnospiraceae bacterium]|nr:zinc ribbon domain-containing protein [Lachnospiraceae bacterium]